MTLGIPGLRGCRGLRRPGPLSHIAKLRDEEIRGSYKLPPKKELDWNAQGAVDPDLTRILVAAEGVLREMPTSCVVTAPQTGK